MSAICQSSLALRKAGMTGARSLLLRGFQVYLFSMTSSSLSPPIPSPCHGCTWPGGHQLLPSSLHMALAPSCRIFLVTCTSLWMDGTAAVHGPLLFTVSPPGCTDFNPIWTIPREPSPMTFSAVSLSVTYLGIYCISY